MATSLNVPTRALLAAATKDSFVAMVSTFEQQKRMLVNRYLPYSIVSQQKGKISELLPCRVFSFKIILK